MSICIFEQDKWRRLLPELSWQYHHNAPFPHVHLEGFINEVAGLKIVEEFPNIDDSWTSYKHYNENKSGNSNQKRFPPFIKKVFEELNSHQFISWLSELTGIPNLLADPDLVGGGMHQSRRGGFLNIHADFTRHSYQTHWRRRCNLLLYLNHNWQDEWGGHLELWDKNMSRAVKKISPLFNHAVIFNTSEDSFHGHPEALKCPLNVLRKSIAIYYYTFEPKIDSVRSTNYQSRPEDGFKKKIFIWLDKKAVGLYTRLKKRLKISDKWASAILRFLSK